MTREQYNLNPKKCLNCEKEILCPEGTRPSEIQKKKFCNRSCAATFNNKNRDKKIYHCKKCGKILNQDNRKTLRLESCCDECNPSKVNWDDISYGEIKGLRKYQVNSRIRTLARKVYEESGKPKLCIVCGYDKHYEVCHIKGISTFPDNTLISTINNIDNLVALCPNCHWELDNGELQIDAKIN